MKPKKPEKTKLLIGIMYKNDTSLEKVKKELIKKFGAIDHESQPYLFDDFSMYYEKEMGKKIYKKFLTFEKLIDREKLADIKLFTNSLEEKYSKNKKRTINLDPGYITKYSLILASAKERYNKILLRKGIYGEITLTFAKSRCISFEYTHKDYRDSKNQEFFLKIRNQL